MKLKDKKNQNIKDLIQLQKDWNQETNLEKASEYVYQAMVITKVFSDEISQIENAIDELNPEETKMSVDTYISYQIDYQKELLKNAK